MSAVDRQLYHWAMGLSWDDLSAEAQAFSKRCLLDLCGVLASGIQTDLYRFVRDYAKHEHGGDGARLPFEGVQVSLTGAALVTGMTIDAIDAHDGHRGTKGHAGCGVFAAVMAYEEQRVGWDLNELLTALVVGYEIAIRAGLALHATADDYHTSGAWVAIACAALGCRYHQSDFDTFCHAIGIAEYHGPRSQMMRCIDHPTMVKDGSGWGAMAGVGAASLARWGFTGAPAVTITRAPEFWQDLGTRWHFLEQYFKPYPVCRWALPAVQAMLDLKQRYGLQADNILRIDVETFHEGMRLHVTAPQDTEQAQYSLPWPIACAATYGTVEVAHITGKSLHDEALIDLAGEVHIRESERFNRLFPGERWAQVTVTEFSGRQFTSEVTQANGDPETPLTEAQVEAKFFRFAVPAVGQERADWIERAIDDNDAHQLREALFSFSPALLRQ